MAKTSLDEDISRIKGEQTQLQLEQEAIAARLKHFIEHFRPLLGKINLDLLHEKGEVECKTPSKKHLGAHIAQVELRWQRPCDNRHYSITVSLIIFGDRDHAQVYGRSFTDDEYHKFMLAGVDAMVDKSESEKALRGRLDFLRISSGQLHTPFQSLEKLENELGEVLKQLHKWGAFRLF